MKKIIILYLFLFVQDFSYSQSGWFTENTGISNTLSSTYFIDGLTGWTAGANGTILKTINGGNSWLSQNYQNTNYYCAHFFSLNTGIVCGSNGVIIKTTNSGISWTSITSGVTDNLKSLNFINSSTGWIAGDNGKILKTVDGGNSWTAQYSGLNTSLNSICFSSVNSGWAVGETGKILRTTNGGTNWVLNTDLIIASLNTVNCLSDNTAIISGKYVDGGGNPFVFFYKTVTGGQFWEYLYSGSSHILHSVYFANQNKGWAAGDSGTVLGTTNAGENWIRQITPNVNDLYSIYFPDVNVGYASGNNGAMIKTVNAGYRDTIPTSRRDLGVIPIVLNDGQLINATYRVQFKSPDTTFAILRSLNNGSTFDTLFNNFHLDDTGKVFDGLITRIQRIRFHTLTPPGTYNGNFGVVGDPVLAPDSIQSRLYGWDYLPLQNKYLEGSNYNTSPVRPWQSVSMALSYPCRTSYVGFKSAIIPENLRKVKIVFTGYGNGQQAYRFLATTPNTNYAYQDMREVPLKVYEADETDSTAGLRQLNCAFLEFPGASQDNKWEPTADSSGGKEVLYIFNSNYSPAVDTFYSHKNLLIQQPSIDVMYVWGPKLISPGLTFHINDEFTIYPYTVTKPDIVPGNPLYYEFTTHSVIGIQPISNIIPGKYSLLQNYPNPFNPSTTIKFSVPGSGRLPVTSLKIYDIIGREVVTLVNDIILPGEYSLKWDATGFASGVYFYRLVSGDYIDSKKMILLK